MDLQTPEIYDIQVGGVSLKLKTKQKPDCVNSVVQMVEGQVRESLRNNANISIQKALILSCLNLAENYVELKKSACRELDFMESKIQSIQSLLKA